LRRRRSCGGAGPGARRPPGDTEGARELCRIRESGRVDKKENLRLCRVGGAFENPQCTVGASGPRFGSHYGGGLASAGLTIGSPRVLHRFVKSIAAITNTAEVYGSVALPTPLLYHAGGRVARRRTRASPRPGGGPTIAARGRPPRADR